MKKYFFSIGLLFAILGITTAQSHVDALRYSQHTIGGTARSVAMGGAFGALGGDFSSLSNNPAGLGLYRSSEFTFTPEFYLSNASTRYYGNEVTENKFNFNFSNLGYVAHFDENSGALTAINFGVGFNRIANFHRNSIINGDNMYTTYTDYMATQATRYGFDEFSYYSSALFFDGELINEATSAQNETFYVIDTNYLFNNGDFRPTEQYVRNYESGRINEWDISLGFNFTDIVYFGVTLGIQPLSYKSEQSFKEFDASDRSYNYFNYNTVLDVTGTGYTGKIGVIVRPIPALRLGAAFHLPVKYQIKESYNSNLTSRHVSGTLYPQDNDGYRVDQLRSDYSITTPFKLIGSAGIVLNKFLILSSDVEYIDYSSMRMKGKGFDLSDQNEMIKNVYRNNINIKSGAEVRLGSIYFRGGFGYIGSPYKSGEENADAYRLNYSGGIGIRSDEMFIDFAFHTTAKDERSFLYQATDGDGVPRDNLVNIDNRNMRIMTTIGFKF